MQSHPGDGGGRFRRCQGTGKERIARAGGCLVEFDGEKVGACLQHPGGDRDERAEHRIGHVGIGRGGGRGRAGQVHPVDLRAIQIEDGTIVHHMAQHAGPGGARLTGQGKGLPEPRGDGIGCQHGTGGVGFGGGLPLDAQAAGIGVGSGIGPLEVEGIHAGVERAGDGEGTQVGGKTGS